jgi:hypothetical protein
MSHGWENGQQVPSEGFEYPSETDHHAAALTAAREAVAGLLSFAVESRNPTTAGRKMIALAWLVGALPGVQTQRDLARTLNCSAPAVCKLTSQARGYLRRQGTRAP